MIGQKGGEVTMATDPTSLSELGLNFMRSIKERENQTELKHGRKEKGTKAPQPPWEALHGNLMLTIIIPSCTDMGILTNRLCTFLPLTGVLKTPYLIKTAANTFG